MQAEEQGKVIQQELVNADSQFNRFLSSFKQSRDVENIDDIIEAFELAKEAHGEKYRYSGEPYIIHPVQVAGIVSNEIGLGVSSVIAALLHEVVTSSNVSYVEIEKKFGKDIATMVEGLTKISSLDTRSKSFQAETFRKLLLSMAEDVRVILIKLADRLHNLRNIHSIEPQKQIKIAMETSYLYAPLAHRLGLYNLKSELEDLAMKYIEKDTYQFITRKLKESKVEREKLINEFIAPIKRRLREEGFGFQIKSRTKSVASIWNKMKKQNLDFEDIYDIFAIRIILDAEPAKEKEYCWRVYSIVTDSYNPNPQRLRDWISIPKSNGYESLHTTVVGPHGKWVEVQIRTQRMDEIAEKGYAAHWRYKGVKREGDNEIENWLNTIRDIIESTDASSDDFIDNVKLNLYNDEVFVFTPNGDLKKFPQGSSVLDFAYDIHSELGNTCVGAKINNKNVTLKQSLENGDKVEIYTSKNQKTKEEWQNYVVTSKAKSKIKASLREEVFKEAELGKELLKRRLKNWKIPYSDELVNKLLKEYRFKSAVDFYYQLANEKIDIIDIKERLLNGKNEKEIHEDENAPGHPDDNLQQEIDYDELGYLKDDYLIIDEKIKNVDYRLAKCCNPVFGDEVFGFVTIGEGIKIHRLHCPNAQMLFTKYPYRIVRARWTKTSGNNAFQTSLRITGMDEAGLLGQITDIISKDLKVTIRSINMNSYSELFDGTFKILIKDTKHLEGLIQRIQKIKGISKVTRLTN